MKILRIKHFDTYPIRRDLLYPHGHPKTWEEYCKFEGDQDDLSFHLGGFVQTKLVSVASFYFHKCDKLDYEVQFELKGMATLENHRGLGLGSNLIKTAFPIMIQNQAQALWCEARESAVDYYKKIGMKPVGDMYKVPSVGMHQLMVIELK